MSHRRGSHSRKQPQRTLDKAERDKIKAKFRSLDTNGDGNLSIDELRDLLQKGSKNKMPNAQIRALFRQADKDRNGLINFDEFVDYLWSPTGSADDDAVTLFEAELPLGGGDLRFGGKQGNVIVDNGFVRGVKVGWHAVAINGKTMKPADLVTEFENLNRRFKRCRLTFQMDAQSAEQMSAAIEARRAAALHELEDLLDCPNLEDIGELTPDQRAGILQDKRLPRMLVDAHAVYLAAVLLERLTPNGLANHLRLVRAVEKDSPLEVTEAIASMSPQDLLRRDGDGNVPLHHARSELCVRTLLRSLPHARHIFNMAGRNPLNERLAQGGRVFDCDLDVGPDTSVIDSFLCCDCQGICAAMRVEGESFEAVSNKLPSWELLHDALQSKAVDIVPALENVGGEHWPGLIAFHCFRDVMLEGSHTTSSYTRLTALWQAMRRLLRGCIARDNGALDPAKALLRATKGPCCPPIDMRLPYREDLKHLMNKLQLGCGETLAKQYENLQGSAATWLKFQLGDHLNADLVPDEWTNRGLKPRLRMDFQLVSGTKASQMLSPDWIKSESPDFCKIFSDLVKEGVVGTSSQDDVVYDTLRLAGMGEKLESGTDSAYTDDSGLTRLYAAYLRGVCQRQQKQISEAMQKAIGKAAVLGKTFFPRSEAKGFPRIMVKTLEAIREIEQELGGVGVRLREEFGHALVQSPAFVNDINGVTLLGETPEDLKRIFEELECTLTVLRTKNTYRANIESSTNYRDIKLWPCIETEVGFLVVEVQLILTANFFEKTWMHLPYQFERGDFDWPYIPPGPSAEDLFQVGWRLFHGIAGSREESDMKEAKECCIEAAKRGHFLARGMCYKEGWGKFKKDHSKALEDFTTAAEAGRREGKCKVGVNLMHAATNVTVNRDRGYELLVEAAREGELEAMYQLGQHELDYRDQMAWLGEAAHLGHTRACLHPLMASRIGGRRLKIDVD